MSKLSKKDLSIIEPAFKFISTSSDKAVFQLSKKTASSWIKLKVLSPSENSKFPEFNHFLVLKRKKYWLRTLEKKYFILCPEAVISEEFHKLSKLSEVKKLLQVINLDKSLKDIAPKKEKATKKISADSAEINWSYLNSLTNTYTYGLREFHSEGENKVVAFPDLSWSIKSQLSVSHGQGMYIYQADCKEYALKLQKISKEKDKKIAMSTNVHSPFESPNELFSSFSFKGEEQGGGDSPNDKTSHLLVDSSSEDSDEESESKSQLDELIIDLLPTPIDSYKNLLDNLPREKVRAKYFNPNFPLSSVTELNNSHHFWALISPQYQDVESFAVKLRNFYGSLSAKDIEQLVNSNDTTQVNLWAKYQSNIKLNNYDSKSSSFRAVLDTKLEDLQSKNEQLTLQLNELKRQLLEQGKYPDTDLLYLQSLREKKKILEEIENTFKVLHLYSDRLKQYSLKHPNFFPNFYLSIFGSRAILSKYDSLVCDALLDLNDQLNEIVFYQQEVERLLFERLSTLHQARKAEMKLEFLEQEDSLSKLVLAQQQSAIQKSRTEELKRLEIQGSLELTKHTIQKEIEAEKFKLSSYLDKLQQLDYYPDYEEQSQQLRGQKIVLKKRIAEYREEIYALKLKAESIERQYSSFITAVREQILEFQKEVSGIYSGHLALLHSSINQVWEDWANKGVDYLERILARKKELIKEFSEIVVLELKKMYSTQDSLLEESRQRKKEWERVYKEMVDEFKTLGYYLSSPKPSENYHRYLPKMDKSVFNLSPEIKKLIYYRPSLKYIKPKVNELIGLSPKLLNDDEFLVIDQVWTKLTPIQEHKLKEKILKESQEKDKEKLKELLQKAKEDLSKRLEAKDYTFKTLTFERDFPQEADEEERYKKLKAFEKASFHNWKEMHFTTSELRYKFKDMLSHLSKKLFTLKEVERWGDQLNITDKSKLEDSSLVEKLSEYDYFVKTSEKLSLVDSSPISSFKSDETDLYDLEDEGYLSILEALDEGHSSKPKLDTSSKKGMMPKLEDWSRINLKRYKEERKKADIVDIKEGLLSLEQEIQVLQKAAGNYKEACELERNRREILFSEMETDLAHLKKYLEKEEDELNKIFADASDMIDLNFEEIDKKLEARRKLISDLQDSKAKEDL